jgi:hypothetical protein
VGSDWNQNPDKRKLKILMSITSTLAEAVSQSIGAEQRNYSKIEETPSSNTGSFLQPLDSLAIRVDYMRVIFRGVQPDTLRLLSELASV